MTYVKTLLLVLCAVLFTSTNEPAFFCPQNTQTDDGCMEYSCVTVFDDETASWKVSDKNMEPCE
jgi:hypothetical protein